MLRSSGHDGDNGWEYRHRKESSWDEYHSFFQRLLEISGDHGEAIGMEPL